MNSAPELHADVAVLGPLRGTWEGSGAGEYPTTADCRYGESVVFSHVGQPVQHHLTAALRRETGRRQALFERFVDRFRATSN